MKKMMHIAAQYLAAAGISFLDKKEDDSHTNLGFSVENQRLETHPLSASGIILSLNYNRFTLDWNTPKNKESLSLDGKTHRQVLDWLTSTSDKFLNKKYQYQLHYKLPYTIDDSYTYKINTLELKALAVLRTQAQHSVSETLNTMGLTATVRVWPHHFDTGAYTTIHSDIAVGFGLAIPDTVVPEHYYYCSGYKGGTAIDTSHFGKLSVGQWKNNGFKGAVLAATNATEKEAIKFFTEAINTYKKEK